MNLIRQANAILIFSWSDTCREQQHRIWTVDTLRLILSRWLSGNLGMNLANSYGNRCRLVPGLFHETRDIQLSEMPGSAARRCQTPFRSHPAAPDTKATLLDCNCHVRRTSQLPKSRIHFNYNISSKLRRRTSALRLYRTRKTWRAYKISIRGLEIMRHAETEVTMVESTVWIRNWSHISLLSY